MSTQTQRVAWKVEIHNMTCIVFATTKRKAQWIATKSYWEAYGNNGVWPRAVAWRCPQYDDSPVKDRVERRAWCEDYVRGYP